MNYGEVFAQVLTSALKQEEEELRNLATKAGDSRQTVKSIHEYYESWLSVPLAKQALGDPSVPQLEWESNKVDLQFRNESQLLATFEIKFKDLGLEGSQLRDVVKDFRKQTLEVQRNQDVEHYVVLVLCGNPHDIERWEIKELQQFVADVCPAARLILIAPPGYVQLNTKPELRLGVFVVRVTTYNASR